MFEKKSLVNEKTGEHYTKYFYTFNESDQIVGILFGHFAPFTGPNGHGRMVTALENIGAESFLIVTPENNKHFDDEREMFNATQRAEIIQSYLDSEGLDGVALPYKMKRGGAKSQMGPLVALAAEKFGLNIRPVFCFGPDREDLAAEVCNKFGEIKDPTHCEYIVDYERGTSGTKVRQLIKAGDIEGICKETGYKTEVAEKLIKLRNKNMKMNENAEFENIYNEAYNVRLSFSDFTDAQDFKSEMKDRFDYPTNVSKHQVVHGTTESGNTVFVESFKKIYEGFNEPLMVFEDLAEEYGNEAGRDYSESIDGQVFSFKNIPFPIGEEETFKDRLSEKLPEYEVELYHSGERYWTRDGEHINKVTFKIFKKSLNESTQLLPLYHATEEVYDVQKAAERLYKERTGYKYNTHLYHFEGGNVFIVFTSITGWKDVQNLLVPIKKELQEEFESLKFDAGTCQYGGCIVIGV